MNQDVHLGDLHSITTYDGNTLTFDNQDVALLAYGGYGAPPTDFQTRRGYRQHGATEIDFTLGIRTISVLMWAKRACSRAAYWQLRSTLHDYLRPNRNGPMTLTLRRPDGSKRAIKVRATPGLQFQMLSPDSDIWQIEEQIDFVAFDPTWFDPSQSVNVITGAFDTNLIFPITFPITFGAEGLLFDLVVTSYPGTWKSYPIITLEGPYTQARIENLSTGVRMTMLLAITAGETRIIDLTPGIQSIVDGDGNNKFSDLSPDSNLVDLNIRPDPEVSGGTQTIRITMFDGAAGTSEATISYYTRYFAI